MLLSRQKHPFMLTDLITFHNAMTVDEGRALDIVCLSFSKASEVD